MNNNTDNTKYESFLRYAYELYKYEWCEERGYDIENWSEEFGFGGESFVCLAEFEDNEFTDEEYMAVLLPNNGFFKYWESLLENHQNGVTELDDDAENCYCVSAKVYGTVEIIASSLKDAHRAAQELDAKEFFWNEPEILEVFPCKPS